MMEYLASATLCLLDALAHISPLSSKNTLRAWIKEGRVHVDGVVVKQAQFHVLKGQKVTVGKRKKIVGLGLSILYEDAHLVVVDKPTGLLSVSTAFEKGETAHALLRAHYFPRQVFVVHRLDQEASGVMVFALDAMTRDRLKDLFELHAIERAYTAIVEGQLEMPQGTWQSYQYEDKQYKVHETADQEKGQLAITHYRTLATSRFCSLLQLHLETGRKNQIRVHCEAAGHSIIGDKKYGAQTNPIRRLGLHAHLLAFIHPRTKKLLRFESPPPEAFQALFSPKP